MTKQKKIAIQNEIASIRKTYEAQKTHLPAEAISIIELLFGLFNIILLAMGLSATSQNSHLPPSRDPYRAKNPKKKAKKNRADKTVTREKP